jgi:oligopeptide transport system permease protein
MTWRVLRGLFIMAFLLLGFALLLLLPREMKVIQIGRLSFIAEFPFNMELYKNNIKSFLDYIHEQKGLGHIRTGMKVSESTIIYFRRSLSIILPCFIGSGMAGIVLGSAQFRYRDKKVGRVLYFLNWIFSSVPDFFLYIAIQYLFIKLIRAGLPDFNLYGNDSWYSFIFPAAALSIFPVVHIAKFLSVSLLHEYNQDYIRTSYSKGMGETKVLVHMLKNCSAGLINQTQIVMLYILTSLPIIESLSNFKGAGYVLLESILSNQDNQALGLMIPFLLLMTIVITVAQLLKSRLSPIKGGEA